MHGMLFAFKDNFFSRSGLNAYLDWQTRFIEILAFKTAKVARISELI
jgi:hypothetical protein